LAPDDRIEEMVFQRKYGRAVVAQVVALGVAGFTACSGRNETANERAKPAALKGGERLTWTQNADSLESLRAHAFRLYVDGKTADLSDIRCNETHTNAGYECSGLLPTMTAGRHSLEITSVVGGIDSPRSAPIIVVMDTSAPSKGKGGT
jgi:hypothetical protein